MTPRRLSLLAALSLALGVTSSCSPPHTSAPKPVASRLRLVEIGADSTAFDVVSTLVVGPTESILFDAQYHAVDARRVADAIQASGTHLKAIVLSHADEDHVSGTAVIVARFPKTPVYISSAGLAAFMATSVARFGSDKARLGAVMADSLVTPTVLPSNHLTVDGEAVEVIPDLTGDVLVPSNSILWIPGLRTALAGDVAFDGVHPWLGSSDSASRVAWRASLTRIAALAPASVVAGHKKDVNAPDSPEVLTRMRRYLDDFDALLASSHSPAEVRDAMFAKYPDLAVRPLLGASAAMAWKKKTGASAGSP